MRGPHQPVLKAFQGWVENQVLSTIAKYAEIPLGGGSIGYPRGVVDPPYQRRFDPRWIYQLRRNGSLVNNAVEEKVNQTLRRGISEPEKKWEARCPHCKEEFGSEKPFRDQVDDEIPEDVEIDFDSERICPNCGEMVEMETPDPEEKKLLRDFVRQANGRSLTGEDLEPEGASSVSQSLLGVLREASWDIESFDDEWFILDREYKIDDDGRIRWYQLRQVYRAPPERMRYVVDDQTGNFGGQYWVCVECRETKEHYTAETEPQACSICGNKTYEAFAVSTKSIRGSDEKAENYYIRGEFVHKSLYEPSRFYGHSPIVSLWEETRTLEKMDEWYYDAYKFRRAPRGAVAIKSSNQQKTREWNQKQFEKMQGDPNHIPTLMDDGDSDGDPIKFIKMLEDPAAMQHMEMREWFKERVSAKWGVTPIFQGSPSESGLSQSLEIQVSNRAADRLRTIQNEVLETIVKQLGVEGWRLEVEEVEEENEQAEVELQLKNLQAAQQALSMGREVEWTDEQRAYIKPGTMEEQEQEGMGMGGLDGLGELGSGMEETAADQGGPGDMEDFQTATEAAGGDRVDLGEHEGAGGQAPQ